LEAKLLVGSDEVDVVEKAALPLLLFFSGEKPKLNRDINFLDSYVLIRNSGNLPRSFFF
jgi:hypothetical protein